MDAFVFRRTITFVSSHLNEYYVFPPPRIEYDFPPGLAMCKWFRCAGRRRGAEGELQEGARGVARKGWLAPDFPAGRNHYSSIGPAGVHPNAYSVFRLWRQ